MVICFESTFSIPFSRNPIVLLRLKNDMRHFWNTLLLLMLPYVVLWLCYEHHRLNLHPISFYDIHLIHALHVIYF